jgi:glycosyltransferase involved in cell wall biosynthesis
MDQTPGFYIERGQELTRISIVHIITTIELGGAEKQLLTLASCQKEKGDLVEIIFLKDSPSLLKEFTDRGITVNAKFSSLAFWRQVLELRKRRKETDVVFHAHLPRAETLCALALNSKSFIVTRHNTEIFFPIAPKVVSRILSKFVLRRAFASVSISKAVSEFIETAREFSKSSKNYVIYYGIPARSRKSEFDGIEMSKEIHLGTVARLVPQKNLPLLLETTKELSKIYTKHFTLSIVGKGPLQESLELQITNLNIQDFVIWRGTLPNLDNFYKSLDVFVLLSKYEGFGLVLLEAMSYGIPVIARATSAIPEVLGENHPGLVVSEDPLEIARSIWMVLSDRSVRKKLLEIQSMKLKQFDVETNYRLHRDLYLKLLKQNGGNRLDV